ncbi:hypothetical protein NEUTE2DRAFT_126479 [Neurospora tetrasperma FGSC 2509]|nr:hypothetical protein NEUTE2DRAFT_126479 [Neurospora tetrasperma FGSC 2509]
MPGHFADMHARPGTGFRGWLLVSRKWWLEIVPYQNRLNSHLRQKAPNWSREVTRNPQINLFTSYLEEIMSSRVDQIYSKPFGMVGKEGKGKGREGNTEQTYTVEVYVMLLSTQLPHVLSSIITYNPALYDQGKALLETNISVC